MTTTTKILPLILIESAAGLDAVFDAFDSPSPSFVEASRANRAARPATTTPDYAANHPCRNYGAAFTAK